MSYANFSNQVKATLETYFQQNIPCLRAAIPSTSGPVESLIAGGRCGAYKILYKKLNANH
jgi:hypothetical protein